MTDGEIVADIPRGLFSFDGSSYMPSEFTRGPWRPDAQHGGPPSALLVHLCEPEAREHEFIAQLDVELVGPVPLSPLVPSVARRQISTRVARVDANLLSEDVVVAHASALLLKTSELDDPDWVSDDVAMPHPPVEAAVDPPRWASGDITTYHRNAVEHRFTAGSFLRPGPAADWIRLRMPVVEGSEPSGLERMAAAADFGSGISAVYPADSRTGLINVNTVISMYRPMVGEWVSLDSVTHLGPQGTGLGITQLGDVDGRVGVATQSLLGYSVRQ